MRDDAAKRADERGKEEYLKIVLNLLIVKVK